MCGANNVANTKGSIGYVEYAYAKQNKLTTVSMINKDGKTVEPNSASFQAAAASADWEKAEAFYVVLTDQPGAYTSAPAVYDDGLVYMGTSGGDTGARPPATGTTEAR